MRYLRGAGSTRTALAGLMLLIGVATTGCATTEPVVVEDAPRPAASTEATTVVVPLDEIELTLEPFADGLEQPLYITGTGEPGRMIVLEKTGRAWEYGDGVRNSTLFLDLSDSVSTESERGLLGIAFPHGFEQSGRFYVNYTDTSGATVISRFTLGADGTANPDSEVEVLSFDQPYSNHNGGMIEFGPDGMLYIGTGDGGSGGDPQGNGQRLDTYLGKLLRLDVELVKAPVGSPAGNDIVRSTPDDNPYIGNADALDEIWAYGLRNPWRFSFDRETGDLWIGDVGQNAWEEIDFQPADSMGGENYGWATLEGTHPYPANADPGDTSDLVMPIVEYDRDAGESVTGGYVYRGSEYPALTGVYLYGDYESGRIWGLRRSGDNVENVLLAQTSHSIASFGEDDRGELYLVDLSGRIMRIAASAGE